MLKKYILEDSIIEVCQVEKDNFDEIKNWVKKGVRILVDKENIPTAICLEHPIYGYNIAFEGDYIFKSDKGDFFSLSKTNLKLMNIKFFKNLKNINYV